MDLEVSVSVRQPLAGSGRITAHELPPFDEMACIIYQGELARINEVHHGMVDWSARHRYKLLGPSRILYLEAPGPGRDPSEQVKEIQYPVEKKHVINLDQITQEQKIMDVKIESKPAFTVVGLKYHGKNENDEIPQLWGKMNPRWSEIPARVNHQHTYGICGNMDENGAFSYVAGVEVSATDALPEGMVAWEVPAGQYAVFACTLKTIGETYKYAFETWLPASDYNHHPAPDFEYYDETFNPDDPASLLYIYIPVEQKAS